MIEFIHTFFFIFIGYLMGATVEWYVGTRKWRRAYIKRLKKDGVID